MHIYKTLKVGITFFGFIKKEDWMRDAGVCRVCLLPFILVLRHEAKGVGKETKLRDGTNYHLHASTTVVLILQCVSES